MSDSGPLLVQLNTAILLGELSTTPPEGSAARPAATPATLDDLPDAYLDDLASRGADVVWMLGAWQTGPAGRAVSRSRADWRRGYLSDLPSLTEDDIRGSPFAVTAYRTHSDFGGDEALSRLRARLARRGMRLMLDFVPNHVALDHPWAESHPEYFLGGSEADLAARPGDFVRLPSGRILAHGRDPYFPGWPDTLQLNYRHAGLREAVTREMESIALRCDGVRCDMAMLLLPEVFRATWGDRSLPADGSAPVDEPFWPGATGRVRDRHPGFEFLAEVYWDREWELLQQGFDHAYDKRLCDRLHAGDAGPVRGHLRADLAFQRRCARFLENHDEPRAAAQFPHYQHRAAAVVTYLTPGLRFFHEGQWDGRKFHASIHLSRRQPEAVDHELRAFYAALFGCLRRPELGGSWRLLAAQPAWGGNPTHEQYLAWCWDGPAGRLLVVVNYGPYRGQCYVPAPWGDLAGRKVMLRDLLGPSRYEREGGDLAGRGLYLDLPPWGYHVFELTNP